MCSALWLLETARDVMNVAAGGLLICQAKAIADARVRTLLVLHVLQDGEPQAIDCLASCYDDTSRPPLLSYKHIQAHLSSTAAGHGQLAVSQAVEDSSAGDLQQPAAGITGEGLRPSSNTSLGGSGGSGGSWAAADGSGPLLQYSGSSSGSEPPGSAPLTLHQQQQQQLAGADSWQVLFEGLEQTQPAVTVTDPLLDFGCCSRLSPSEPRTFQVRPQQGKLS